ncbi:MAG: disulfide bond formation protein B [Alphaproteobacteria bacterium]|nr:disulfide bond formation protein B [Alphaproteobacteria bacterium]MCL2505209.1 disulfide bond formation protein B [Alphaproteobacteria bacterium]
MEFCRKWGSLILRVPYSFMILLLTGIFSICFAFVLQYFFDVAPCHLCLLQRYPFVAVAIFAFIGLIIHYMRISAPLKRNICLSLLVLCALSFLASLGLGIFHSGVELKLWQSPLQCAASDVSSLSIDQVREMLMQTSAPRCDEIRWTFLGLSLANWNIPFSIFMFLFTLLAFLVEKGLAARSKA